MGTGVKRIGDTAGRTALLAALAALAGLVAALVGGCSPPAELLGTGVWVEPGCRLPREGNLNPWTPSSPVAPQLENRSDEPVQCAVWGGPDVESALAGPQTLEPGATWRTEELCGDLTLCCLRQDGVNSCCSWEPEVPCG